jgi:hypothetical protein
MKNQTTKKFLTFILLLSGMFSFSIAKAQFICDCVPGHPAGYCFVDSHGNTKCKKLPHHCGGCTRIGQDAPAETSFTEVYPNPASGSVNITFTLAQQGDVSFEVFDVTGRFVTTIEHDLFEADGNEVAWDASRVNQGIYFIKMKAGSYSAVKRISVIK